MSAQKCPLKIFALSKKRELKHLDLECHQYSDFTDAHSRALATNFPLLKVRVNTIMINIKILIILKFNIKIIELSFQMTFVLFCFPSCCLYSRHHYLLPGLSFLPQILSFSVRWVLQLLGRTAFLDTGEPNSSVTPLLRSNPNSGQASPFLFCNTSRRVAFFPRRRSSLSVHALCTCRKPRATHRT